MIVVSFPVTACRCSRMCVLLACLVCWSGCIQRYDHFHQDQCGADDADQLRGTDLDGSGSSDAENSDAVGPDMQKPEDSSPSDMVEVELDVEGTNQDIEIDLADSSGPDSGEHPDTFTDGECAANCTDKQCGDDGCGGSCGACTDSIECTSDKCNESGKCTFTPNDSWCNDGNPCTTNTCDVSSGCDNKPKYTVVPAELDCDYLNLGNGNDGSPMCRVGSGIFQMGEQPEGDSVGGNKPIHEVCLSEFYIDQHEVTNAQYAKFVAEYSEMAPVVCTIGEPVWSAGEPPPYPDGKANHPVVCVTWEQALEYCQWAGKSLPTEAQWEEAARGVDGQPYPWGQGDLSCELANHKPGIFDDPCVGATTPVVPLGENPYGEGKSPFGLYNTAGNATEWTWDDYNHCYYCHPGDDVEVCEAPCSDLLPFDPTGPTKTGQTNKVVRRGGGWYKIPEFCLTYMREDVFPTSSADYGGFRCAYRQCAPSCGEGEYCIGGKCLSLVN